MTEGTVQIPVGRRRIIKRPRLTRLLDEANAPLILLVAPAGYGKTTLARQWLAKCRHQYAWYTATPPSADVSALALGLARVLETIVAGPTERMRQRLLAVPASEEEPEIVAEILADSAATWPDKAWLVVDDYHHVAASTTAERFFARFAQVSGVRLLLTSRAHPSWVSAKHTTYGEIVVLGVDELALTDTESALVLGVKRDDSLGALLEATRGWPVVTGLAAVAGNSVIPAAPSADTLYEFLADEVFNRVSPETQTLLCRLAFVSTPTLDLARQLGDADATDERIKEAERQGLIERDLAELRLHPLHREFLKGRFTEYPKRERHEGLAALTEYLQAEHAWDDLFELVKQDPTAARLDALIAAALRNLVAEGRFRTLAEWCDLADGRRIQTPSIQLARAELNFSRGSVSSAHLLAQGAAHAMGTSHPLASRAWIVTGRSAYFLDEYPGAVADFGRARAVADRQEDEFDALWGGFLAAMYIDGFDAEVALKELEPITAAGFAGVIRYASARNMLAAQTGTQGGVLLDEMLPLVALTDQMHDVWVRTSFLESTGRGLIEQARYDEALALFQTQASVAEDFGFRPVLSSAWVGLALAEQGLRRFKRATAYRARAEAAARACDDTHNLVECELLRVRMLIALGAFSEATEHQSQWRRQPGLGDLGEMFACRGLAHACAGDFGRAEALLREAEAYPQINQTRVLRGSARLVIALGQSSQSDARRNDLVLAVQQSGSVDHLITACRGFPSLVRTLCSDPAFEPVLVAALNRSRDHQILAGQRITPIQGRHLPRPFLSNREEEVFALLRHGLSNKEIGRALFISDVTVKVHLRSVYRKLGVRNRVEAVAVGHALEDDPH